MDFILVWYYCLSHLQLFEVNFLPLQLLIFISMMD